VHWLISIAAGITVAFAWIGIWAFSLHALGIAPLRRRAEDRADRRERLKRMGKLRYILIFGMLGTGLAFGLAITAADFLEHNSHSWGLAIGKLVFLSVLFGWFSGARTWSEAFREPVPFPPNYAPPT
jgi:hypothetical protein